MTSKGSAVDVLPNRQLLHKAKVLPESADSPSLSAVEMPHALIIPLNPAFLGLEAAVAEIEECCFTSATGAQHNNMLLWMQGQIRGGKTSLQSCLVKLQALTHRIFPS